MNARLRFALLAGLVVVAIGLPLLLTVSSRLGINPVERVIDARADAVYAARQATLRSTFTSTAFNERWRKGKLIQGDPVGRLIIPSLAVDLIVIEGVSGDSLKAGAGHYPDTALPGEKGNAAIAGQRTSFGEAFRDLNKLNAGDVLIIATPSGRYTYELLGAFDGHTNPWVTEPTDWSVVGPVDAAVVTLTTLEPSKLASNRLIARFALVGRDAA